jgi:hypothetical protein
MSFKKFTLSPDDIRPIDLGIIDCYSMPKSNRGDLMITEMTLYNITYDDSSYHKQIYDSFDTLINLRRSVDVVNKFIGGWYE